MYSINTVIGQPGSSPKEDRCVELKWPQEGLGTIPDWISSPEVYQREIERIYPLLSFSRPDQFLSLAFAQLTFRESLRGIEICLRAHSGLVGSRWVSASWRPA